MATGCPLISARAVLSSSYLTFRHALLGSTAHATCRHSTVATKRPQHNKRDEEKKYYKNKNSLTNEVDLIAHCA